jgi:hypothetical protein
MDEQLDGTLITSSEAVFPAIPTWLPKEDETAFEAWKGSLVFWLPTYTLMFTAIHLMSIIVCGGMDTCAMPVKDKHSWHNKYDVFALRVHRDARNVISLHLASSSLVRAFKLSRCR